MTIKNYIVIILLFCSSAVVGQSFTASVSRTTVTVGEPFEVTFTLNANGSNYKAPNFEGFQVVGGPNQSSSYSSINGVTSQTVGIGYDLVATKVGTFTIGSALITMNGKEYSTKPITIKVVKGSPQQQQNSQQQMQGDGGEPVRTTAKDISKQLFIKAVVDKTHVYQGEQITLIYKLYTQIGILGNEPDKAPDLTGFWSQDLTNNNNPNQRIPFKIEVYKGMRYNVAELKKTILFPEHSGDITIDPLGMTIVAQQPRAPQNVMEQMFGGGYSEVKVKVASAPVVIHVKPLPEEGKPAGFTGAVGKFAVSANVDKHELKANESLTYNLKITGSGNIKLLKDANINPPTDFEKYDPKVTDSVTVNEQGVAGTRTLSYLLIPRHQGDYTLAPVQFSYFNPATNRYVTLSTKSFAIKVNKGTDVAGNVTSLNTTDKQDVKLLNKDIRYIKTTPPDLYKSGEGFYGSAGFYLLLLLGPLAFLGAFAYRRYNEEQNSDLVKVKSRKASKMAAKHMANAQVQLQQGNIQAFYEAVSRGMYGYISNKLNIPAANLNRENIASVLKLRLPDEGLIQNLIETLDLCEMARFAPVSGISQKQVFEKAKGLINDMEEKI